VSAIQCYLRKINIDQTHCEEVPTFIIAGHETTRYFSLRLAASTPAYSFFSVAVAWAIYALRNHPAVHAKLNTEARAFHTDTPTMDELNGMTYL
jgi:hypothetical protein